MKKFYKVDKMCECTFQKAKTNTNAFVSYFQRMIDADNQNAL